VSAAARALARAQAVGVQLKLRPDGGLRLQADAPPPPELLAELRRWRDDIARLLAAQDRPSDAGGLVGSDDDPERRAMLAHYAEPPSARPYVPDDPYTAGLLTAALQRPPSWAGSTPPPPRGAWCSCCGRSNPQAGGRWWRPRNPRSDGLGLSEGWRCMTCHPPPFGSEVEERRT
jgi:hypothetical protein